jgi:hypothetical protein
MRSFMNLMLASTIVIACVGCTMTLPVRGQIQNSAETFSGTATGHMDGGGSLQMVSSRGSVCKGNFVYINGRQGEGVFNCDDGRSGPFTFVSTGAAGTGYGTLNNERFIFTFGNQGG